MVYRTAPVSMTLNKAKSSETLVENRDFFIQLLYNNPIPEENGGKYFHAVFFQKQAQSPAYEVV